MTSQCRVCSRKLFFILRNIQHALWRAGAGPGTRGCRIERVSRRGCRCSRTVSRYLTLPKTSIYCISRCYYVVGAPARAEIGVIYTRDRVAQSLACGLLSRPKVAYACAYHLAAHQPGVLRPSEQEPTHAGPAPNQTLRPLSPRAQSRDHRRRTPCNTCDPTHARRCQRRRSPCNTCDAACARRCQRHRSPCNCSAVARARK